MGDYTGEVFLGLLGGPKTSINLGDVGVRPKKKGNNPEIKLREVRSNYDSVKKALYSHFKSGSDAGLVIFTDSSKNDAADLFGSAGPHQLTGNYFGDQPLDLQFYGGSDAGSIWCGVVSHTSCPYVIVLDKSYLTNTMLMHQRARLSIGTHTESLLNQNLFNEYIEEFFGNSSLESVTQRHDFVVHICNDDSVAFRVYGPYNTFSKSVTGLANVVQSLSIGATVKESQTRQFPYFTLYGAPYLINRVLKSKGIRDPFFLAWEHSMFGNEGQQIGKLYYDMMDNEHLDNARESGLIYAAYQYLSTNFDFNNFDTQTFANLINDKLSEIGESNMVGIKMI